LDGTRILKGLWGGSGSFGAIAPIEPSPLKGVFWKTLQGVLKSFDNPCRLGIIDDERSLCQHIFG
jgi:hypothetical protein